ncbi:hypothetical protein [Dactylosporangium salmoneum]|uniref:Uncharacterized protein n=1 Tax=Dactylosporangium salmoneum TaxID=53361 RepID=A0ABP5UFE6_9ACTN
MSGRAPTAVSRGHDRQGDVDTAEEPDPLLPPELCTLALQVIREEPEVEDLDI